MTAELSPRELGHSYVAFLRGALRTVPRRNRPIRIVADAGNGMAGRWFSEVTQGIENLDVFLLNAGADEGFVYTPDMSDVVQSRALRKAMREHKADLGILFDGDACRCAFYDERGNVARPDAVIALLARMHIEREPGAAVVFDHRASDCVAEEIERASGHAVRERVGHPHMKKAMMDSQAVFGGDLSGRYYFRDAHGCESPIFACLNIISHLVETGRRLSECLRPFLRFRSSGVLQFDRDDLETVVGSMRRRFPDARADELDGLTLRYPDWWCNIRRRDVQPQLSLIVEARTRHVLDEKLAVLRGVLENTEPNRSN